MKRLIMSDSSVEWRIIPVEELRKWNLFSTMDDYFLQNIRLAHAHGMFGFLVTADDIVYVVGTNRKGALGIGGILEAPSPVKIDPLCGQSVKEFVIAGITSPEFASCFALTEDGRVFSWGSNSNGQLGTHGAKKLTTPELIKFDSNVKIGQISVGDLHTLALTEDTGEVYSCGWNAYGQLGLGTDTDQYEPRKITANFGNIRVKQISCSSSSSFALSESGEVRVLVYVIVTIGVFTSTVGYFAN
ncbi:ultraviolet-B receptor UVR8 [Folsomia candida]|uniref:ultraviolet-B receptor UVR8 n=1 Tax=Folsomia candida TaxID=158441 RepID=UPI0016054427|nr:ultraviolet-B receptor UVR8 [Folsomia candida]